VLGEAACHAGNHPVAARPVQPIFHHMSPSIGTPCERDHPTG
jgi:hypothetical protein